MKKILLLLFAFASLNITAQVYHFTECQRNDEEWFSVNTEISIHNKNMTVYIDNKKLEYEILSEFKDEVSKGGYKYKVVEIKQKGTDMFGLFQIFDNTYYGVRFIMDVNTINFQ